MSDDPMYLGVDAGGTHCRARLVADDGTVLGEGLSGPANTRLGVAAVMSSIRASVSQALRSANVARPARSDIAICIGLAGVSRTEVVNALRRDRFCNAFRSAIFVSDILVAHVGAHAYRNGGSVLIGTGSVAMATVGEEFVRIGGKGFPASDLGSGAHMGLLALQRTLLAADGIANSSRLTRAVLAIDGFNAGINEVHPDSMSPTDYAALAPLVVRHAEAGDPVATEIVQECAAHVSDLLVRVERLGVPRLVLAGGLAPTMRDWIPSKQRSWLVAPYGDPLDGALAIAGLRTGRYRRGIGGFRRLLQNSANETFEANTLCRRCRHRDGGHPDADR